MKKLLIGFLSLLLLVTFLFTLVPGMAGSILGWVSGSSQNLPFGPPHVRSKTSFYYTYFVTECLIPFEESEKELLQLLDRKMAGEDINIPLNLLEVKVQDLDNPPKYHHKLLEPLYGDYGDLKTQLVDWVLYTQEIKDIPWTTAQREQLNEKAEQILEGKQALYQHTVDTLKAHKIVFYLEDDGSITIYD